MTQLARVLAAAMAVAALGLTSLSARAADYNWKFYTFFNSNDFAANMQRSFAEDVTKATGGRLAITLYSAGKPALPPHSGPLSNFRSSVRICN